MNPFVGIGAAAAFASMILGTGQRGQESRRPASAAAPGKAKTKRTAKQKAAKQARKTTRKGRS